MTLKSVKTGIATAIALSSLWAGFIYAEPVRYDIEPTHTFVNVEVTHSKTSTTRARFDQVDGFIVLDRKAGTGQADIAINANSISSGIPDFDAHLKNQDFLDVAKAPTAKFIGTDFSFDGDKVKALTGQLTMLGKTAPVTLTASNFNCYDNARMKAQICGGDFETTIKRSQWGMTWGIDKGIPDDVRLLIQIEAIRK
ncbi:polyisoprenoid-binding protein [Pollutimonas subterranea]|uniref:Polyisoprenoid-binding protein n=1 Tax=Pollutimonas subterranea TaxID=2045210 RepID=A0A2N4U8D2_9BURK|nr:YceI family protein [Pollutimonas subterranea]PLC51283.1 polyisoprenoid-binding protein [Pollutimonas subterranea]